MSPAGGRYGRGTGGQHGESTVCADNHLIGPVPITNTVSKRPKKQDGGPLTVSQRPTKHSDSPFTSGCDQCG